MNVSNAIMPYAHTSTAVLQCGAPLERSRAAAEPKSRAQRQSSGGGESKDGVLVQGQQRVEGEQRVEGKQREANRERRTEREASYSLYSSNRESPYLQVRLHRRLPPIGPDERGAAQLVTFPDTVS